MSFTSVSFLLFLFPAGIILNYFTKKEYRVYILTALSVLFYAWSGVGFLILLTVSALLAFVSGIALEKAKKVSLRRGILALTLIYNIGVLFGYKYLFTVFPGFSQRLARVFHIDGNLLNNIVIPLGISFYTFSILSYVIDVYIEKCEARKNFVRLYLYVIFFPKIIQGPITRYTDFMEQLDNNETGIVLMDEGFERFIKGMVKKVLIADRLYNIVSYPFDKIRNVGTIPAWIGIITYLLQLYFDFSGYSDMAIGLGNMLGFRLPENFDHPYLSETVSEYWRRFHITLGEWFRDYVYTPVSRVLIWNEKIKSSKNPRLVCDIISLLCVWVLTGIWHGAGLKFLLWGLWYFVFISFERIRDDRRKKIRKKKGIKGSKKTVLQSVSDRLVTVIATVFGYVIFRASSLKDALIYWYRLVKWDTRDGWVFLARFDNYVIFAVLMGIVFSFPIYGFIKKNVFEKNDVTRILHRVILIIFAVITFCYAVGSGSSAFLYEVF
ncbi:MAG: hypothetical protein K6F84_08440 [Lachnospiraceae bacterium]|nr:hypothetical protein [Lachnospiraceae bacterium]